MHIAETDWLLTSSDSLELTEPREVQTERSIEMISTLLDKQAAATNNPAVTSKSTTALSTHFITRKEYRKSKYIYSHQCETYQLC